MPSIPLFSSLLSNNKDHHSCSCGCHNNFSDTSSIHRWFPRIRRRSSSASSTSSNSYQSRRPSTDYMIEIEDKQIDEFQQLYRTAVDEMAYAIESQGSIYYDGDLITATEAVDSCLDQFKNLMQTLNSDRSHRFQQEWTETLFELRSRLESLPRLED